jgi:hypothetical protein
VLHYGLDLSNRPQVLLFGLLDDLDGGLGQHFLAQDLLFALLLVG